MKTKIAIEVAFGMSFIHSKKQIHRNLNISNIRLNNVYESKIINFSQVRVSSFGISNRTLTKSIGEIAYMSPEMAREEDYNEKTDVYSYGVILHVLFSGKPPKQSMNEKLSKKEAILAEPSKWISSKCIDLIKKCISNEIQQRPSFDEIIDEIYSNNFELASEIDISSVLRRYLSLNRFRSQHQYKS